MVKPIFLNHDLVDLQLLILFSNNIKSLLQSPVTLDCGLTCLPNHINLLVKFY